ncbi:hypothetical protein G3M48_008265 [Beauveria asiatica]|uniref:non-specific serine/threonine protein kinase n=1 Tax=Beauveria asiatica TaxID=1069075 RepID=A0AAW0RLL6_9HYPO
MQDQDLIARVYAVAQHAGLANEAIKSSIHYVRPQEQQHPPRATAYNSREPTPAPEECDDTLLPDVDGPYLELRFSRIPRSSHGFIFGRHPSSDVVLPDEPGISHFQCSITFDHERRLIVKDLQTTMGTAVTYDDQANVRRSGFRWIVGGHPYIRDKVIMIRIHKTIWFRLIVAHQDTQSPFYVASADRYCAGQATTQDLFQAVNLRTRLDTQRPSGAHTPGVGLVCLDKEIGRGGFAVVTHHWNVSTGNEYVVKQPLRVRNIDRQAWENEAHIMSLISDHSLHIVKFLGASLDPIPRIILEYVPGGSLGDHADYSTKERWLILSQCLSALSFLHEHDPVIVHRDIKPANILIQSRDRDSIHVKLGDFGLSKDYNNMSTICGTYSYLAPEIYENAQYVKAGVRGRQSYTEAVDIWSLGVVLCELEWPLPQWRSKNVGCGTYWCEQVLETFLRALGHEFDAIGEFVLNKMLSLQPDRRHGARQCLEATSLVFCNDATDLGHHATPRAAKRPGQSEQTTIRIDDASSTSGGRLTVVPAQPPVDTDGNPNSAHETAAGNLVQGHSEAMRCPHDYSKCTSQRRVAQVSHISTRELLFDKPGLVRMVVRRQAVSMRTSSFQINASDLFRLVQLDKRSRDNLIRKLKQHQAIEWETTKRNGWVPFRDGVFLCQALGIENELRPLLLQSRINLPRRERNYLLRDPHGFKVLQWNGYDLPYNPSKQIVSITALVRLTNAAWEPVYQFLRTRPKITKTVIRKGTAIFIGTYISYEDAISVGRRFNLDLATVEHLASSAPSPHMTSAATSPVASTSVSNVASLDDTQLCDLTHNDVGSAVAGTSDPAQDADTSTEQCSYFTEANYENGSYLAPAHQSHLELLGAVHPVEGLGKMSTASSGYGIGSCDSGFEFAEFLTEA